MKYTKFVLFFSILSVAHIELRAQEPSNPNVPKIEPVTIHGGPEGIQKAADVVEASVTDATGLSPQMRLSIFGPQGPKYPNGAFLPDDVRAIAQRLVVDPAFHDEIIDSFGSIEGYVTYVRTQVLEPMALRQLTPYEAEIISHMNTKVDGIYPDVILHLGSDAANEANYLSGRLQNIAVNLADVGPAEAQGLFVHEATHLWQFRQGELGNSSYRTIGGLFNTDGPSVLWQEFVSETFAKNGDMAGAFTVINQTYSEEWNALRAAVPDLMTAYNVEQRFALVHSLSQEMPGASFAQVGLLKNRAIRDLIARKALAYGASTPPNSFIINWRDGAVRAAGRVSSDTRPYFSVGGDAKGIRTVVEVIAEEPVSPKVFVKTQLARGGRWLGKGLAGVGIVSGVYFGIDGVAHARDNYEIADAVLANFVGAIPTPYTAVWGVGYAVGNVLVEPVLQMMDQSVQIQTLQANQENRPWAEHMGRLAYLARLERGTISQSEFAAKLLQYGLLPTATEMWTGMQQGKQKNAYLQSAEACMERLGQASYVSQFLTLSTFDSQRLSAAISMGRENPGLGADLLLNVPAVTEKFRQDLFNKNRSYIPSTYSVDSPDDIGVQNPNKLTFNGVDIGLLNGVSVSWGFKDVNQPAPVNNPSNVTNLNWGFASGVGVSSSAFEEVAPVSSDLTPFDSPAVPETIQIPVELPVSNVGAPVSDIDISLSNTIRPFTLNPAFSVEFPIIFKSTMTSNWFGTEMVRIETEQTFFGRFSQGAINNLGFFWNPGDIGAITDVANFGFGGPLYDQFIYQSFSSQFSLPTIGGFGGFRPLGVTFKWEFFQFHP